MKTTIRNMKRIIKEALDSKINWDFFVKSSAHMMENDPDASPSDVASDVFRPSDDSEVREMLAAMRNNDPEMDGVITRVAAEMGIDPIALGEYFVDGLDATEEYMDDEDEDEDDFDDDAWKANAHPTIKLTSLGISPEELGLSGEAADQARALAKQYRQIFDADPNIMKPETMSQLTQVQQQLNKFFPPRQR